MQKTCCEEDIPPKGSLGEFTPMYLSHGGEQQLGILLQVIPNGYSIDA